ncbi:MAG: immune inhibitor A domain-containing protein [Candidatus Thorarchaeota archaeon]
MTKSSELKSKFKKSTKLLIAIFLLLGLLPTLYIWEQQIPRIGVTSSNIGEQRMIVIPVYFEDIYPSTTLDNISILLERTDDYLREISYRKSWITFSICNWVLLDNPIEYYGVNAILEPDEDSYLLTTMVKEAVTKIDPDVNFQNYDHILIIHAGYGRQSAGSSGDITRDKWPDTCNLKLHHTTQDWTVIDSAMIVAELAEDNPSMGAIAHELGHDLGADDLYHPDYGLDIGPWCLMSSGGHLNDSYTPCHMCLYTKLSIGYIDSSRLLRISNGTFRFEIVAISIDSDGFYGAQYFPSNTKGIYFLVEARKQIGFDSSLERSGVIITVVNTSASDTQHGMVLLASDTRYSLSERAYGPNEFYVDTETGFGVKVIEETEVGYVVEVTTKSDIQWQRESFLSHQLEFSESGACTTLENGTIYLAISGLNYTTDHSQIDIYRSENVGKDWTHVFSTSSDVDRRNPVLVNRAESTYSESEPITKVIMFCESAFSENHTIEAWDILEGVSYNLTSSTTDARKPVAAVNNYKYYLAYEIHNSTHYLWDNSHTMIAYCSNSRASSLQWPQYLQNCSSPAVCPARQGNPPMLTYLAGENKTHQNEVWILEMKYSATLKIYESPFFISQADITVNRDWNLASVVFLNWTKISQEAFQRDVIFAVCSVEQFNITLLDIDRIPNSDTIQGAPLVRWGISPSGIDAFYIGCNNGSTCCFIRDTSKTSFSVTQSYRFGIPTAGLLTTNYFAERWIVPFLFEFNAYSVSTWSLSFIDLAHYDYNPIYQHNEVDIQFIVIPYTTIPMLLLMIAFPISLIYSSRKGYIQFDKETIKQSFHLGMIVTLSTLLIFFLNYFLGSYISIGAGYISNMMFYIAMIVILSKSIRGLLTHENEES